MLPACADSCHRVRAAAAPAAGSGSSSAVPAKTAGFDYSTYPGKGECNQLHALGVGNPAWRAPRERHVAHAPRVNASAAYHPPSLPR